eukprot:scaffold29669_cov17-Tisochrysis_lutea.AAC.1
MPQPDVKAAVGCACDELPPEPTHLLAGAGSSETKELPTQFDPTHSAPSWRSSLCVPAALLAITHTSEMWGYLQGTLRTHALEQQIKKIYSVPPHYEFPGAPVLMSGPVVEGFGRGSKQMGVPTANIDPKPLETTLKAMHNGVYFGWVDS